LFLRICDRIGTTATFKSKTRELARESYNPDFAKDAIFFNDRARQAFVKLDGALYERLQAGEMRL
jgi:fatty-acyl-CoA synthase